MVVELLDSEAWWPGFESWLCHLFLGRSWADYLNALCLNLLMCKMWKIIFPKIAVRVERLCTFKVLSSE